MAESVVEAAATMAQVMVEAVVKTKVGLMALMVVAAAGTVMAQVMVVMAKEMVVEGTMAQIVAVVFEETAV